MQMSSDELDLLSNIETKNADFLKRFVDKEKIFAFFKKVCDLFAFH